MLELNSSNFDEHTKDGAVLVDFWATWCGPCRMMGPILESISSEYEDDDTVTLCKVDVDANQELAKKFNITSVPTLAFMKNGQVVKVVKGLQTKPVITEALNVLKEL